MTKYPLEWGWEQSDTPTSSTASDWKPKPTLLSGEPETRSGGWTAVMVVPAALVVAVPAPEEKPNAPSAACAFGSEDEAEIEKLAALPVFNVMAPPWIDDGVVVPVIESMAESRLPTEPVVGSML